MAEVKTYFRPEFINRIDEVVFTASTRRTLLQLPKSSSAI